MARQVMDLLKQIHEMNHEDQLQLVTQVQRRRIEVQPVSRKPAAKRQKKNRLDNLNKEQLLKLLEMWDE